MRQQCAPGTPQRPRHTQSEELASRPDAHQASLLGQIARVRSQERTEALTHVREGVDKQGSQTRAASGEPRDMSQQKNEQQQRDASEQATSCLQGQASPRQYDSDGSVGEPEHKRAKP